MRKDEIAASSIYIVSISLTEIRLDEAVSRS